MPLSGIASNESINGSHPGRIPESTLLAPDIVVAILNRRQPVGVTLAVLMRPFPVEWREQRAQLLGPAS